MTDMGNGKRNLVFISHATPEDNQFTLWLSTRLKLLGYEVWSDVTQLFGGEKWWEDIAEAIHDSTIKFVIVITRTSLSKPGVQREVELALQAESSHRLTNFIIPIIIDDSEFGGHPYGLSDRNIIPFSKGWGFGFERLVERLERDSTPKESKPCDLGAVLAAIRVPTATVEQARDTAISNTLPITKLPDELNFFRLPGDAKLWRKQLAMCPFAWFEWGGMLATFADHQDITPFLPKHVIPSKSPKLNLPDVLCDGIRNHKEFLRGEVIKKVNNLIAESWNHAMREKGLNKYELSNGRASWFFPANESNEGLIQYPDQNGQLRRRKILGFSGKNKVYWHYAIEVKVHYGQTAKLSLIPHVVFTEDGRNPIADSAKMHRLRRGFCKNWWNPRWRELLLLYVHRLSDSCSEITLSLGEGNSISFSSRPNMVEMCYQLCTSQPTSSEQEDEVDIEVDLMDEVDDDCE